MLRIRGTCVCAVLAALSAGGLASAAEYHHSFPPFSPGHVNHAGGEILAIDTTYDSDSHMLSWDVLFGEVQSNPGIETGGFTLVLSAGENPSGVDGEMAAIFFDATSPSPTVTVYAYNGNNPHSSYHDGSGADGIQPADAILSSLNDIEGAVNAATVTDHGDGTRTFSLTLDVTSINAHTPIYPGSQPWKGAQFGEDIGIWFHTYAGLSTAYEGDYLVDWSFEQNGGFDVPEPTSLMLALAAGVPVVARRRRA